MGGTFTKFTLYALLGAFLALVLKVVVVTELLYALTGADEHLTTHFQCEYGTDAQSIVGPEDIVQLREGVYIVVESRVLELNEAPHSDDFPLNFAQGALHAVYSNERKTRKIEISGYPKDVLFYPHGIYLRNDVLYVINHAFGHGGERLDAFFIAYDEATATVSARYRDSTNFDLRLYNNLMDDLIVVSDTEFIITKYLHSAAPLKGIQSAGPLPHIEQLLRWVFNASDSHALHCVYKPNAIADCVVIDGTHSVMANGIDWDGKDQVALVETITSSVKFYKLNRGATDRTKILTFVADIATQVHVDNINYDAKRGSYIGGGTGRNYEQVRYIGQFRKTGERPASMPFKAGVVEIDAKTLQAKTLLYQDNAIMGCSVAQVVTPNFFILGSWVDNSLSYCVKQ